MFGEEVVDLGGGELVGVATVDFDQHRIARFYVLTLVREQMPGEDLLGESHRALAGVVRRQVDLACVEVAAEVEQAAALDDERGDRIVARGELVERDFFAALQPAQHVVVGHELADVDVVARVNWRKRRRHREPAAAVDFALRGRLAARTDALLDSRNHDLEVAIGERALRNQSLSVDDQPRVSVVRDLVWVVVEADPGRRSSHPVLMSSSRSPTFTSSIVRSSSPANCFRISSGSFVRNRTRLPVVSENLRDTDMTPI